MNKKRFCPNFQASTSTSKTLFYATLKLEPILKGGLPFPVLFVPLVSAETHCQQIKMQMLLPSLVPVDVIPSATHVTQCIIQEMSNGGKNVSLF